MNNPWGSWWNNAAPAASGLNWIDGPPGMEQPAWGGEQWGDTSFFSLQPEVPNIIKKPVSLHNRWKALQQEDEDINYDLTDTKGPTGNIKEEFEQAGWKVVQKKSQSTLHGCLNLPKTNGSGRKGGKESSKSESNRSGSMTQIYGKYGKSDLHSLTAEEEESVEPILGAVEHWKAPSGDWTCIKTVVDSGAVDSVAPLTMAPAAEVKSSPG